MNEEIDEKEVTRKPAQEPAKSFDELLSPVAEIPDEVLATKDGAVIMKALFKERSLENRKLKGDKSLLDEEVKDLEIELGVYKERMHWKNVWTVISSVLLAISTYLITVGVQHNLDKVQHIGFLLIIVVIIINLLGTSLWSFISRKKGESGKT